MYVENKPKIVFTCLFIAEKQLQRNGRLTLMSSVFPSLYQSVYGRIPRGNWSLHSLSRLDENKQCIPNISSPNVLYLKSTFCIIGFKRGYCRYWSKALPPVTCLIVRISRYSIHLSWTADMSSTIVASLPKIDQRRKRFVSDTCSMQTSCINQNASFWYEKRTPDSSGPWGYQQVHVGNLA